jgi:hypothetical protein
MCRLSVQNQNHGQPPDPGKRQIRRSPQGCPSITNAVHVLQVVRDVRLLAIGETPNFVNLNGFAWQVSHCLVEIRGTRFACIGHYALHGFLGKARQLDGGTHGTAFTQAGNNAGALIIAQSVHTSGCE